MLPSPDESLDALYRQASDALATTDTGETAAVTSHGVYTSFKGLAHTLDDATMYGVVPLCFAILLLVENFQAQAEGRVFRVRAVLGRFVAVLALLLLYGYVCRLITGL